MTDDVVVTVPKRLWEEWLKEGDLGSPLGPAPWEGEAEYHFWIALPPPPINRGARVYIVAHGKLRGYAPLERIEVRCRLRPERACLVRRNAAVAVTIPEPIRGFQGWRYCWWQRTVEFPFPEWRQP